MTKWKIRFWNTWRLGCRPRGSSSWCLFIFAFFPPPPPLPTLYDRGQRSLRSRPKQSSSSWRASGARPRSASAAARLLYPLRVRNRFIPFFPQLAHLSCTSHCLRHRAGHLQHHLDLRGPGSRPAQTRRDQVQQANIKQKHWRLIGGPSLRHY